MMKDVDVKVTKKVVDAEEVKDHAAEPVFVEVKPASIREFWKSLSVKKKLGLILGSACAAAGAATAGYFAGRSITMASKAESLELPSSDVIETEASIDEVE